MTWKKEDSLVISMSPKNLMILDNRADFPFLEHSEPCQLS